MTTAALVMLGLAGLCFAVRLVRGPSLSDRVIGLDGLVIVGVGAVAVRAMATGSGAFLPVLVVVTLVGFVGTAASARFIEGRAGRRRANEADGA
jgi:multisubunit Na+/H+ antiporter MnhF subunit